MLDNLVCVFAYHGSFVLYDVIFFRHHKELQKMLCYDFLNATIEVMRRWTYKIPIKIMDITGQFIHIK